MVDRDVGRYTGKVLQGWKTDAERSRDDETTGRLKSPTRPSSRPAIQIPLTLAGHFRDDTTLKSLILSIAEEALATEPPVISVFYPDIDDQTAPWLNHPARVNPLVLADTLGVYNRRKAAITSHLMCFAENLGWWFPAFISSDEVVESFKAIVLQFARPLPARSVSWRLDAYTHDHRGLIKIQLEDADRLAVEAAVDSIDPRFRTVAVGYGGLVNGMVDCGQLSSPIIARHVIPGICAQVVRSSESNDNTVNIPPGPSEWLLGPS